MKLLPIQVPVGVWFFIKSPEYCTKPKSLASGPGKGYLWVGHTHYIAGRVRT